MQHDPEHEAPVRRPNAVMPLPPLDGAPPVADPVRVAEARLALGRQEALF